QAIERLSLLRRELREKGRWVRCPISHGTPDEPDRSGAAHQALERPVGIGACHAGGVCDGVPGGRAETQQRRVDSGLRGREPEGREINRIGHERSSEYYYFKHRYTARGPRRLRPEAP